MLVVDESGSMAGAKLAAARVAAAAFVDGVDLAFDQVGLVGFASEARLAVGLTTDRARIAAAIDSWLPTAAPTSRPVSTRRGTCTRTPAIGLARPG